MKKSLVVFITLVISLFCLVGCGCEAQSSEGNSSQNQRSMFVEVENGYEYYVVYHKDTKVMYSVSDGAYNRGTFTALLNPDGTPMLYECN